MCTSVTITMVTVAYLIITITLLLICEDNEQHFVAIYIHKKLANVNNANNAEFNELESY